MANPPCIVVISDVHGNLPVLQAVLKDAAQFHPDHILVTGDICGGPYQDDSLNLLLDHQAWFILGNWEKNIFDLRQKEKRDPTHNLAQFALLNWCSRTLSARSTKILKTRPYQDLFVVPHTEPIRLAHGAPDDPYCLIDPDTNLETVLAQVQEKVFICGHTHTAWIKEGNHKLAINPGSLLNPIHHKSEGTYAVLTWKNGGWLAQLRTVPYDFQQVVYAFQDSGMLTHGGPFVRALLFSIQSGENVSQQFVDFALALAREADPQAVTIPDAVWFAAEQTFPWGRFNNLRKWI